MRVMVFFDLPVGTAEERRNYRRFRKYLISNGYMMLQESVYCRMALNQSAASAMIDKLKANKPSNGLVQMLCITEKQFSKMEYIIGEFHSDLIDSDERLVII